MRLWDMDLDRKSEIAQHKPIEEQYDEKPENFAAYL
jgi:hypothetical protein